MIKAKELMATLEMMVNMYGEECMIGTFSENLNVYDESGDFRH